MTEVLTFEKHFKAFIQETDLSDPSHDMSHVERVVATAKHLCQSENACLEVVVPAAWLHDCVYVKKNSDERAKGSKLSADRAIEHLRCINYPDRYFKDIHHAISAHSFSAGIVPKNIHAKVVQDADRLDALGAIGIARCFISGGLMKHEFHSELDPFCNKRKANDELYILDHFFVKVLSISKTLKTESGRKEGRKRAAFIKVYLERLKMELPPFDWVHDEQSHRKGRLLNN